MILTPNPKNLLPRPESGHSPDPAPYPDITLLTPSPIHSAFTREVSSPPFFLRVSFYVHFFNIFSLYCGSLDSMNFVLPGNCNIAKSYWAGNGTKYVQWFLTGCFSQKRGAKQYYSRDCIQWNHIKQGVPVLCSDNSFETWSFKSWIYFTFIIFHLLYLVS